MPPAAFLKRVLTGRLRAAHVRPLQGIRLRGDANIDPYNLPFTPGL